MLLLAPWFREILLALERLLAKLRPVAPTLSSTDSQDTSTAPSSEVESEAAAMVAPVFYDEKSATAEAPPGTGETPQEPDKEPPARDRVEGGAPQSGAVQTRPELIQSLPATKEASDDFRFDPEGPLNQDPGSGARQTTRARGKNSHSDRVQEKVDADVALAEKARLDPPSHSALADSQSSAPEPGSPGQPMGGQFEVQETELRPEVRQRRARMPRRKIRPEQRGGRPRGVSSAGRTLIRAQRAELACQRFGMRFKIGLEADFEELSTSSEDVELDGMECVYDRAARLYIPPGLTPGSKAIRGPNGLEHTLEVPEVFIFALSGDGSRGHLVRRAHPGLFLLVAPERSTLRTGPGASLVQKVAIEPFPFEGWEVYIEEDGQLEITDGHVVRIRVEPKTLELRPEPVVFLLRTETSSCTPIFAGEPPTLAFDNATKCFIVGDEGPNRTGWRRGYDVSPTSGDDFKSTIRSRGRGWYFIRTYDDEDILLQSVDFWYEPELAGVSLTRSDTADTVVLEHTTKVRVSQAASVSAASSGSASILELTTSPEQTRVDVPLKLVVRAVDISISPDDSESYVLRVPLHRHWWSLGPEGQPPDDWSRALIEVAAGQFKATSSQCFWLLFSHRPYARSLELSYEGRAIYRLPSTSSSIVSVPLREFEHAVAQSPNGTLMLTLDTTPFGMQSEAVLHVYSRFRCLRCSFTSEDSNEVVRHALTSHLDVLMPKVEEYTALVNAYHSKFPNTKRLPTKINKCGFCNYFVPAERFEDRGVDRIQDHLRSCPAQRTVNGPRQRRFSIVDKIDDIRNSQLAWILDEIGTGRKCSLCNEILLKCESGTDVAHLEQKHWNELYESE
jgi:hypothetical protein